MIADYSESERVAKRLQSASANLHRMAHDYGHARQVLEFVSEMKRNLLAKYIVRSLKAGETATAAESIGRADPDFQRELAVLAEQYEAAEHTIALWKAENCSFEAARSLLALQRERIVGRHPRWPQSRQVNIPPFPFRRFVGTSGLVFMAIIVLGYVLLWRGSESSRDESGKVQSR